MLLTITTSHRPATDLGHLLRKNPARAQTFDLTFGKAHVFYPEATEERCTAALLLEVDPIGLARGKRDSAGSGRALEPYVNDRPYVASSFLSVAIAEVFGSALSGSSKDRPELVDLPIPLFASLSVLPSRGGEAFLRRLFEPLGYRVDVSGRLLDEQFPEWGESRYFSVTLEAVVPLRVLLSHLYVLIPVLDGDKHYWVGEAEVEKLLRHGANWLGAHPECDAITRRYLEHRRSLVDAALAQLAETDPEPESCIEDPAADEVGTGERFRLHELRLTSVVDVLRSTGARRILDLGCGDGQLIRALLKDQAFQEIIGMDVSHRALEIACNRLDRLPPALEGRVQLLQGSLLYRDKRLCGYDAAAVVEVVEHLDPCRLEAFERVLFECARPRVVVLTTPNAEYNIKWETLRAGAFRHKDHRFEWTRKQLQTWANGTAERFGYTVRFLPVGPEDLTLGAPTQMALFSLLT